jgi:curved DNA-binding protein CbpA
MREHVQEVDGKAPKDNRQAWKRMQRLYHPDKTGGVEDRISKKLNSLKDRCPPVG